MPAVTPVPSAGRSRTAPTWDCVRATIFGRVRRLTRAEREAQIADLVVDHEPADGRQFEEIDPDLFATWCDMLVGYRMEIESFDLTAKLSQNQIPAYKPGIAMGLRLRAGSRDEALATFIKGFDGASGSLQRMNGKPSGNR